MKKSILVFNILLSLVTGIVPIIYAAYTHSYQPLLLSLWAFMGAINAGISIAIKNSQD